jgi:hypothetical protein
MSATTSDVLVERLIDWGVRVVFGLPGDGINGLMEALRTRQDRISFVQVRHEEAAAFMACGYAKYARQLGVCLATSGPGAIHLLNGLSRALAVPFRQHLAESTMFPGSRHCPHQFHARLAASRPSPSRVVRLGLRKSHAPAWRSDSFESQPVVASRLVLRVEARSQNRVLSMTSCCSLY